jgi:hypothetical protein
MLKVEGTISNSLINKLPAEMVKINPVGIFSMGMYLKYKDDILIMVHDSSYGLIPFGVGIENYKSSLKNITIDFNDDVFISKDRLFIKDKLEIFFKIIKVEKPDEETRVSKKVFLSEAKRKLAKTGKGVLKNLVDPTFKETEWSKRVSKALLTNDIESKETLLEIIGLGPGLTPSGDDFLIGYFYQSIADGKDISATGNLLKNLLVRTTKISKSFIEAVISKETFSLFDQVCYAKDEMSLKIAIEKLLEAGNNSGADILCGICFARMKYES